MSYDASSLRGYLQRIDTTAPAIQGAAAAMMKHYDKSTGVAVNCWRDMLMQARGDQYLPLLYVANEVLQTSKRNRGNKFLEAFSPVLGQALIYVCGKSQPSVVESIRRTVKIWAERRVFSIRYVNELIKGLEPYRTGKKRLPSSNFGSTENKENASLGGSRFSPVTELSSPDRQSRAKDDFDSEMGLSSNNDGDSDDDDNMFGDEGNNDDSDDDDLFGNASNRLLQIDVDFDRAASSAAKSTRENGGTKKRRRSANQSLFDSVGTGSAKTKRRSSSQHLSTSRLMELMNQVSSLQASFDRVTGKLQELHRTYDDESENKRIESLVGDELLTEFKKVLKDEQEMDRYKRELHSIAQTRRDLELEALRYLPWLERALKQDKEDIDFSNSYRRQLELFRGVYQPTKEARDRRLEEEARRLEQEEALRRRQLEEEERKRFMESAMARQTEAQPGMVWNRATGEYQHLNQEESWRD